MRGTKGSPVTASTQKRFEELYYALTEVMSENHLAKLISSEIGKTHPTALMYIRQTFSGGSEEVKRPYVTAMETIALTYLPQEESA